MSGGDFEQLYRDFVAFESDLDMLNRQIQGVYFWERIRFRVHKHLSMGLEISERLPGDDAGSSEYYTGAKLLAKNLFVRNPFLANQSDLLFYGKGRRKRLSDDYWWDIYVDPVLETLNGEHLCIERPFDVGHRRPAKTQRLRYTDLIQYTGTVLQKTGITMPSLTDDEAALLEKITDELWSLFKTSVPVERMVREDLALRRVRLPLYRHLVRRIDPKVALLTAAYNGRETFVEACQSEGIPVVELQHGVVTEYHLAYSFPDQWKHVFPDYFFSFGEYWSEAVDLPLPDEKVYAVGFPYLERRFREYGTVAAQQRIVVVSQVRIGESLSKFARDLHENDAFHYEVVFKLHPKEYDGWAERYPELVEAGVRVVADDPELYELLASATAQVGVNSTVLFEGLKFGLDTYVVDLPGAEYMSDLVASGHAQSVVTAQEVVANPPSQGSARADLDTEYYFTPEPDRQFEHALADVLN